MCRDNVVDGFLDLTDDVDFLSDPRVGLVRNLAIALEDAILHDLVVLLGTLYSKYSGFSLMLTELLRVLLLPVELLRTMDFLGIFSRLLLRLSEEIFLRLLP